MSSEATAHRDHPAGSVELGAAHRAGLFASSACAIHCAVTPFLVSLLPLFGVQTLLDQRLEWFLVGVAVALGGWTIVPAYRRHHHRTSPVVLFGIGAALMVGARLLVAHGTPMEFPVSVAGALCLVAAQTLNARFRHTCPCDHSTHDHPAAASRHLH
ncbi:MAG: MerC domain-containing protein [Vicinamibacterales bacterium]